MTPFEESTTITIPLDKGQSAVISAFQYHLVKDITWHAQWNPKSATYYAHGNIRETRPGRTNKFRYIAMHRLLCGILDDPSVVVHHDDENGLNNTQRNMKVMSLFAHNRLHGRPNGRPTAPHVESGYISIWRRLSSEDIEAHRSSWPAGIEYGYCWCGCGNRTQIASKTDRTQKSLGGEHLRFFHGHKPKRRKKEGRPEAQTPHLGRYCACGGVKSGQASVCKSCQLSMRRPPLDPETYYDEGRPYRRVPCTKKKYTLVSADKYDTAMSFLLVANFDPSTGGHYVSTTVDGRQEKLHRLLTNAPKGVQIDHANRDSLDNRDWNLRPASNSQQMANQNRKARNTSGYIGVWYRKSRKRWCGQVTFKGKHYFTKHCKTACEAAIERNNLALEIHGEFANLNIIPSEETYHEEVQTA